MRTRTSLSVAGLFAITATLAGCSDSGPSTEVTDRVESAVATVDSDALSGTSTFLLMSDEADPSGTTSLCQIVDGTETSAQILIGTDAAVADDGCMADTQLADLVVDGTTVVALRSDATGALSYQRAETTPELAADLRTRIDGWTASADALPGVVADAKDVSMSGDTATMRITLGQYQALFGGLADTNEEARNLTGTLTIQFDGNELASYSFAATHEGQHITAANSFRYDNARPIVASADAQPYGDGSVLTTTDELDEFTQFTDPAAQ